MNGDERNAVIATGGLAVAAVGTFLPWARIGGRDRSGFATADTFIGLADGALPDQLAWVGRWWYLPALFVLVSWATTFVAGHRATRIAGVAMVVVAGAMWWLLYWAGERYDIIDMRVMGPLVASIGLVTIATTCARGRKSLLRAGSDRAMRPK